MDDFFSRYGWTALEIIAGIACIGLLFGITSNSDITNSPSVRNVSQPVDFSDIQVTCIVDHIDESSLTVNDATFNQGDTFNYYNHMSAYSHQGKNLMEYVRVTGEVNTSIPGRYTIAYTLTWNGETVTKTGEYLVLGGFS